jgi:hypothetical protein
VEQSAGAPRAGHPVRGHTLCAGRAEGRGARSFARNSRVGNGCGRSCRSSAQWSRNMRIPASHAVSMRDKHIDQKYSSTFEKYSMVSRLKIIAGNIIARRNYRMHASGQISKPHLQPIPAAMGAEGYRGCNLSILRKVGPKTLSSSEFLLWRKRNALEMLKVIPE